MRKTTKTINKLTFLNILLHQQNLLESPSNLQFFYQKNNNNSFFSASNLTLHRMRIYQILPVKKLTQEHQEILTIEIGGDLQKTGLFRFLAQLPYKKAILQAINFIKSKQKKKIRKRMIGRLLLREDIVTFNFFIKSLLRIMEAI